jgi:hypothetical protein
MSSAFLVGLSFFNSSFTLLMFWGKDYQKDVVESYLKDHKPPYDASIFNSTGLSRAFPDISANGENYAVLVTGKWYSVSGTSASSPVIGAMITLINDARIASGKTPVGFINPAVCFLPHHRNADLTEVVDDRYTRMHSITHSRILPLGTTLVAVHKGSMPRPDGIPSLGSAPPSFLSSWRRFWRCHETLMLWKSLVANQRFCFNTVQELSATYC